MSVSQGAVMSDVHLQTGALPRPASFRFGEGSSRTALTMSVPLTTETGRKDAWT